MGLSKVDLFYRRLILTKFYTRGWGKPEELRKILEMRSVIADRESCVKSIDGFHCPVTLQKPVFTDDCTAINGQFSSPLCNMLPDLVPKECEVSHFQLVLPPKSSKLKGSTMLPLKEKCEMLRLKPVCIHMAGTGDHGYTRRRELMAKPLLQNSGISSLILENPYYGIRKPKEQTRSGLLHVKDLFIMGACLILEAQILFRWLKSKGYGPLGLTGISMGGHMASLAASNWPEPLALIPCMSWSSSSVVWTEGVLSKAIPWRVLEAQYSKDPAYETQINEMIQQSTVDSYELGKDYVKDEGNVRPKVGLAKVQTQSKSDKEDAESDRERRQQQTLLFMKGVMDQMTHLQNFSVPIDTAMVTFVIAKADAYYPLGNLKPMDEVWPGCEVRVLNTGHIAGFLIHHSDFCGAIAETFTRLIEKYCMPKTEKNDDGSISLGDHPRCIKSSDAIKNDGDLVSVSEEKDASSGRALFRSLKVITIKS